MCKNHPKCRCFGPRSSTWAASSVPGSCAIIRSGRLLLSTNPRGMRILSLRLDGFSMCQLESYESDCCLSSGTNDLFRHRQALRYIIRNLSLPAKTRAQAQLQLSQMHVYTSRTQIRNRCIEGGRARGVLRDFKMSRVRENRPAMEERGAIVHPREWHCESSGLWLHFTNNTWLQFQFRMHALQGLLPGVKKAAW